MKIGEKEAQRRAMREQAANQRELQEAIAKVAAKSAPSTPAKRKEVMPHNDGPESNRRDKATPPATLLAPGAKPAKRIETRTYADRREYLKRKARERRAKAKG
jgi:hypothetical protein